MLTAPVQVAAHKGLRGQILLELKRAQPLTARQLAARLGVSPNAIRHHLKELAAGELILYRREQRGVGAPTYAYRLSPGGEALFPRAYEATLTELLERVAEKAGRRAAVELFEHNCAIRAVAERFPEVCSAEQKFLQDVLGAAVERRTHIASGCNACEYAITFGGEQGRESK